MITCTRILSVEYYESMARQIRREAGILSPQAGLDDMAAAYAEAEATGKVREGDGEGDGEGTYEDVYATAYDRALAALAQDHVAGRDQVAYYVDNGAGEADGVWWTRRRSAGEKLVLSLTPFRKCPDQGEVNGRVLRDLARGRDPETREPLVKLSGNGQRSVGYDLQCAAPKSISVLAAFASPENRSKIFDAHDRAVRRALDHALDEGLIVARVGPQGIRRLPAQEASAAVYRHFTSRAQDPQLHSHAVLLNLAVRQDGTTGAIDNRDILRHLGSLAALYRSELASGLRNQLGFESIREGRNFEVVGVPPDVIKLFSKRRSQIVRAAGRAGFDPASNRGAAQIAAFSTRDAKDRETPLAILEERWAKELANAGWSGDALFRMAAIEADRIRRERSQEGNRQKRTRALAQKAFEDLAAREAVFEQRMLERHVIEAVQCECSANEALAVIDELEASRQVVRLGKNGVGDTMYSTNSIIEAERGLLRTALNRQNQRDFVSVEELKRALSKSSLWPKEYQPAVRHGLNRDGISTIDGYSGTGRPSIGAAVAEAARGASKEVWTISPPSKAGNPIKADGEAAGDTAQAVQAFVRKVEQGNIVLGDDSVVVCDEADRIGISDMAALIALVSRDDIDAKLILLGDTGRRAPDVVGAPMAALVRALGGTRMIDVQHQEVEWQRAASLDLAGSHQHRALEAYDRAGAICWAKGRQAALDTLVRDYITAREPALAGTGSSQNVPREVILTSRRKDVGEINQLARAGLKERALLGEEIAVQAVPRGGRDPVALALAAGDDLLFGEDLMVRGHAIRAGDRARIQSIHSGDFDPTLIFLLARNAAVITAGISELVGNREEGQSPVPKLQHGYCLPVWDAEGLVVDECFVANLRGMGRESISAAMTRHRRDVRLYVDTSRVGDAQGGGLDGFKQAGLGRVMSSRKSRDHTRATAAQIKQAVMEEARASEYKRSPSDYAPSIHAFASLSPMIASGPIRKTLEHGDQKLFSQPVDLNAAVQALRERMVERLSGPRYPTPRGEVDRDFYVATRFASTTPHGRAAPIRKMETQWMTFRRGINDYLQSQCGIAPDILHRFRSHIRTAQDSRAVFAHRDLSGRIIGFEYQEYGARDESGRSVPQIAEGGDRRFTQMGDVRNPTRVYVAQSGVDGLALYQTDQRPERALIVSFGGVPNGLVLEQFRELVQCYPKAEIHVINDHRRLGRDVFSMIKDKIMDARGGNANLQEREPPVLSNFLDDQSHEWVHEANNRMTGQQQPIENVKSRHDDTRRTTVERGRDYF